MSDDLFAAAPKPEADMGNPRSAPVGLCGSCKHFDIPGSKLGDVGYGHCEARPAHVRKAFFTSAENVCRVGKFATWEG